MIPLDQNVGRICFYILISIRFQCTLLLVMTIFSLVWWILSCDKMMKFCWHFEKINVFIMKICQQHCKYVNIILFVNVQQSLTMKSIIDNVFSKYFFLCGWILSFQRQWFRPNEQNILSWYLNSSNRLTDHFCRYIILQYMAYLILHSNNVFWDFILKC